jgi:hypothetical protein
LTRRANQRHDAIIAARAIGGTFAKPRRSRRYPASRATGFWRKPEGKKMRQFGKVDIPQEALIAALKADS